MILSKRTPEVLEKMGLLAGQLLQMVLNIMWDGCRRRKDAESVNGG
ncbi:hypothetical protein [Thermocaproicibacter melissae]|jgi:hypothetical protein|nr:hypothetical protein [Thermocaproicibacter melissae]WBY63478.1 hypothetical protein NOG13_05750 [Thermocaproicibacter melissae]